MPLYRRLPKRGFTNRNSKEIIAINVDVLNRFGMQGDSLRAYSQAALFPKPATVLRSGNGELTKKLTVKVNAVSETAKEKIEVCTAITARTA